jgi:hypothetical protein
MEFFLTGGGNAEWPENSLVGEDEIKIIMLGLLEQNEEICEDDILKVIRWVEDTRLNSMLLELVLESQLNIGFKDGDLSFFTAKKEDDRDDGEEDGEDEDDDEDEA